MNVFGLVFSLCLMHCIGFISAASLTSETSEPKRIYYKRARKMLLRNMTDFHNKIEIAPLLHRDDSSHDQVETVHYTVHNQAETVPDNTHTYDFLVARFLNFTDLLSFSATSKNTRLTVAKEIRFRLNYYSPYSVFEEDWFNFIVFKILEDNGLSDITHEDPRTRDLVTLMVFKCALRDYKKLKIPRYIHLGVISFFFEMVYGKDIRMPIYHQAQMIHFLGEMVQIYDLPETLAYFVSVLQLSKEEQLTKFFENSWDIYNQNAIKLLNFLSTKPSIEEHQHFYTQNSVETYGNVDDYLLQQRIPMIPMKDENWFICWSLLFPCTSTIFDQVPEPNDLRFLCKNFWSGPVLYRKFGIESDDPQRNFFWSINYNNPFSCEKFKESLNSHLCFPKNVFRMNTSHILLLDIIGEIYEIYFFKKLDWNHPNEVYEMLFAEELFPKELSYSYLRTCYNPNYRLNARSLERIRLVFDYMFPKDNPILPLIILGEYVTKSILTICGKFDLNVSYRFGTNILEDKHNSGIQYSSDTIIWLELVIDPNDICKDSVYYKVKQLKRITVTFLEILDFLNDTELSNSYGHTLRKSKSIFSRFIWCPKI